MSPSTNSAEIEAAAAAWFARRESDDWNATDQSHLEAWLDASTAHRVAFLRILAAWEHSGRLAALGAGVAQGTIPPRDAWGFAPAPSAPSAPAPQDRWQSVADREPDASASVSTAGDARALSPSRFWRRARAVAALLVVATVAGAFWYYATDHTKSYRTAVGAMATLPLADGSKVTLNTDSQIHVQLTAMGRRIALDQGEAFFDVAKDATRPFVVAIADKRVIAVGTQFAVRRDSNEIRVLVTEGRVRIEHGGVGANAAATQLAAGSEARTAQAAVLIDQPTPARVEQLLSWRSGNIIFRDTALADAVADFNRYSARKIVIEDPTIAAIRIGGSFRANDADAFLWLLQSGFPIHVEQRSDRVILTKR